METLPTHAEHRIALRYAGRVIPKAIARELRAQAQLAKREPFHRLPARDLEHRADELDPPAASPVEKHTLDLDQLKLALETYQRSRRNNADARCRLLCSVLGVSPVDQPVGGWGELNVRVSAALSCLDSEGRCPPDHRDRAIDLLRLALAG